MKLKLLIIATILMVVSCKKEEKTSISGFKYTIANDAPGENVKEGDYVYFRYLVKVNDSIVFNSVSQSPDIKFKVPKQEKKELKNAQPIVDVLHYMSKGDSLIVSQLIDDDIRKQIGIPSAKELKFHIVLNDIKTQEAYDADMKKEQEAINAKRAESAAMLPKIQELLKKTLADFKSGANKSQVITTGSGLKYVVHETGTGAKAQLGQVVSVQYYGTLMDGTMFDNSFERGQDIQFPLGQGQVIKGWEEAFGLLPVGTKATLIIPAELGYGATASGPIPANSVLAFYVEVVGVN